MDRESQIFLLNRLLANYFVWYMKFHRYVWYIKGKHTFSLLTWLNKQTLVCKQQIDDLVELILLLEGRPFATMEKFIKVATLEEASADDETNEIIHQIIHDSTSLLRDIDELIESSIVDENERMIQYKLTSLEWELLNIKQECQRFFK